MPEINKNNNTSNNRPLPTNSNQRTIFPPQTQPPSNYPNNRPPQQRLTLPLPFHHLPTNPAITGAHQLQPIPSSHYSSSTLPQQAVTQNQRRVIPQNALNTQNSQQHSKGQSVEIKKILDKIYKNDDVALLEQKFSDVKEAYKHDLESLFKFGSLSKSWKCLSFLIEQLPETLYFFVKTEGYSWAKSAPIELIEKVVAAIGPSKSDAHVKNSLNQFLNTCLPQAIQNSDAPRVKALLNAGADIYLIHKDFLLPTLDVLQVLIEAAEKSEDKIKHLNAIFLCNYNPKDNTHDGERLSQAIKENKFEIARCIIRHSAQIEGRLSSFLFHEIALIRISQGYDSFRKDTLRLAFLKEKLFPTLQLLKSEGVLEKVLEEGSDYFNKLNTELGTEDIIQEILSYTPHDGNEFLSIEDLLESSSLNTDILPVFHTSELIPIHQALLKGDIKGVKALIECGANPESIAKIPFSYNGSKKTPQTVVATADLIKGLLETVDQKYYGSIFANKFIDNVQYITEHRRRTGPLHTLIDAIRHKNFEIARVLIQYGAHFHSEGIHWAEFFKECSLGLTQQAKMQFLQQQLLPILKFFKDEGVLDEVINITPNLRDLLQDLEELSGVENILEALLSQEPTIQSEKTSSTNAGENQNQPSQRSRPTNNAEASDASSSTHNKSVLHAPNRDESPQPTAIPQQNIELPPLSSSFEIDIATLSAEERESVSKYAQELYAAFASYLNKDRKEAIMKELEEAGGIWKLRLPANEIQALCLKLLPAYRSKLSSSEDARSIQIFDVITSRFLSLLNIEFFKKNTVIKPEEIKNHVEALNGKSQAFLRLLEILGKSLSQQETEESPSKALFEENPPLHRGVNHSLLYLKMQELKNTDNSISAAEDLPQERIPCLMAIDNGVSYTAYPMSITLNGNGLISQIEYDAEGESSKFLKEVLGVDSSSTELSVKEIEEISARITAESENKICVLFPNRLTNDQGDDSSEDDTATMTDSMRKSNSVFHQKLSTKSSLTIDRSYADFSQVTSSNTSEANSANQGVKSSLLEVGRKSTKDLLEDLTKGQLNQAYNTLKKRTLNNAAISTPLHYPLFDKIKKISSAELEKAAQEVKLCYSGTKNYQIEAVKTVKLLQKLSLNPVVALDMGLGKTLVMEELIYQELISSQTPGAILLISPLSLLEQTKDKLKVYLEEGKKKGVHEFDPGKMITVANRNGALLQECEQLREAANKASGITKVIITTPDCVAKAYQKNKDLLQNITWKSILVDEAHPLRNTTSKTYNDLKNFIESCNKPPVTLITGTPFERDLSDLANLLQFANDDTVLEKLSFDKLSLYFKSAIKAFNSLVKSDSADSPQAAKCFETILYTFAHLEALKKVYSTFFIRAQKTDASIIQDWDGKIPSKHHVDVNYDLTEEQDKAIRKLHETDKNFFKRSSKINNVLFHPSIDESESISCSNDEFIKQSGFLTSFFNNEKLHSLVKEKGSFIVFVDRINHGKILKKILEEKFSGQIWTDFYHGGLLAGERTSMIQQFKNGHTKTANCLIISIGAGGIGLDLPWAKDVFVTAKPWNPSEQKQAEDRSVRVGHEGEVNIHLFRNEGLDQRYRFIYTMKELWESYIFNTNGDEKDRFEQFVAILSKQYREENNLDDNDSEVESVEAQIYQRGTKKTLQERISKVEPKEMPSLLRIKSIAAKKFSSSLPTTPQAQQASSSSTTRAQASTPQRSEASSAVAPTQTKKTSQLPPKSTRKAPNKLTTPSGYKDEFTQKRRQDTTIPLSIQSEAKNKEPAKVIITERPGQPTIIPKSTHQASSITCAHQPLDAAIPKRLSNAPSASQQSKTANKTSSHSGADQVLAYQSKQSIQNRSQSLPPTTAKSNPASQFVSLPTVQKQSQSVAPGSASSYKNPAITPTKQLPFKEVSAGSNTVQNQGHGIPQTLAKSNPASQFVSLPTVQKQSQSLQSASTSGNRSQVITPAKKLPFVDISNTNSVAQAASSSQGAAPQADLPRTLSYHGTDFDRIDVSDLTTAYQIASGDVILRAMMQNHPLQKEILKYRQENNDAQLIEKLKSISKHASTEACSSAGIDVALYQLKDNTNLSMKEVKKGQGKSIGTARILKRAEGQYSVLLRKC